ncbi:hypothetical protein DID78_04625 [Candidatus Marinamargulisbacteria bacterium SCGC AG-343-D04]|nr:hypothetical protein DID78_04625 [Candidatus Marinamargulisbacteria bacterium SCGC AG-343-D04]
MNSDKKLHQLSLGLSIGIHVIIFAFFSFFIKDQDVIYVNPEPIPIAFEIKEVIVKKPKVVSKIEEKEPKRLPGDRDHSTVQKSIEPYYPKDAINLGWEGEVTVKATINSKGRVTRVKLLKSSGFPLLDNAFIETVKSDYVFKPKRVLGVNKIDTITLSYEFIL